MYQRVDGISECNRLNALRQLPAAEPTNTPSREPTSTSTSPPAEPSSNEAEPTGSTNEAEPSSPKSSGENVARRQEKNKGSDSESSSSTFALKSTERKKRRNKKPIYVIDDSSISDDSVGDLKKPSSKEPNMTDLKASVCDLHDRMANGIPKNSAGGVGFFTQVGIDELEEQIGKLERKLDRKRVPSKNEMEVNRLKKIVKDLTARLEEQELYAGSLEHDVDVRIEELEDELEKERKLRKHIQAEHREYEEFIFRDKMRGVEPGSTRSSSKKRRRRHK